MKKGFFFSLDAFFAIMIFTLVLVSVYGYFVNTQELRQQYYFSEDLFNIFTSVRMEEINLESEYSTGIKQLNDWGFIDMDMKLIDQVVALKNDGYSNYSEWIIRDMTYSLFSDRYGISFDINGLIYEKDKEVNALVSRQRFVSG